MRGKVFYARIISNAQISFTESQSPVTLTRVRSIVLTLLVLLAPFLAQARVKLGSEVLAENGFRELRGKRVGLLTNPSGVNSRGEPTTAVLARTKSVKLVAFFAAEHGIRGDIAAGTEFRDTTDAATGLPVYSLYGPGPVRKPLPRMLQGLDALVYDIQDTGCRSYTFIATMGLAMEACAEAGVEFIVLDRPNPLGGLRVEGPRLSPEYQAIGSLVSRWNIPYVYGLTCGELARMINGERWIKKRARLTVIPMKGWERSMVWSATGIPWTPTSPYIPRAESTLHYAAIGMLGEIGGVTIGNRLGMPFQCVLAPWLDAGRLARRLGSYQLPGVLFHPLTTNHNGSRISGVRMEFAVPSRAPLLPLTFYTLEAIKRETGRDLFAEAAKANRSFDMFDRVNGTTATRRLLEQGASARTVVESWKEGEESFRKARVRYLSY